MGRTWQIRPYREGDEHQIVQLRKTVFGDIDAVRLDISTWNWQFKNNPAGSAWIYVAEDHGKIVGQYAAIPTRILWNGREHIFAFSCDTMTHPDYRNQGMFSMLAGELYAFISRQHLVETVWGFPNDQSLPGFIRRLNWNVIARYPLRIIPLRPLRMLRSHFRPFQRVLTSTAGPFNPPMSRSYAISSGLEVFPIQKFCREFDEIWNRYKPLSHIVQIRDSLYLNWRYCEIPEFGYVSFAVRHHGRLAGYIVIRLMELKGHYFGVLMDLFPIPVVNDDVTLRLLRFVRHFCRSHGAAFVAFLLPDHARKYLHRLGTLTIPDKINPRPWYLGCRCTTNNRVNQPDAWHITYGDADIL
jgi:GNAT superfamily N-acetyltransferase